MAFIKKRKLSKKEQKALKKTQNLELAKPAEKPVEEISPKGKIVILPQIITVRDLAVRLDLPVTKLIAELMKNGISATINESIDFETAAIILDELGFKAKSEVSEKEEENTEEKNEQKNLKQRPPVVVVMGHVDHGKTTLLDYIRRTKVASGEAGGITQHIGAYQVEVKGKDKKNHLVTFLDTPGHEAFSAMRAHGANITDIAILVVAAEDGVKPQTKEAISHAKAANVPIVVAINKIDKPEANIEKVKRELGDLDLVPEEWGGNTIIAPISAKTGNGVDKLLEMLLIVEEMEELKADPNGVMKGVVIESNMQKGLGAVATILIQNGTLKKGDIVVVNDSYGRVKRMENDKGQEILEATPSMPVKIIGLKQTVKFGENVEIVDNEKDARLMTAAKESKAKRVHLSLGEISQKIKEGEIKELNLILKADTQGSLEAIKDSLSNLSTEEVVVKIIHDGVGDINESDINLAVSSNALVVGFNVKTTTTAKQLADVHDIKISLYDVIYNLIDDLSTGLSGMLEPEIIEENLGKLKVLKVFNSKKDLKIIGGRVTSGKIIKKGKVKIIHDGSIIGEGVVDSLEHNKQAATEVLEGFECGLGIKTQTEINEGDSIESFQLKEIARKI